MGCRSLRKATLLFMLSLPALGQESRVLLVAPPGAASEKAIAKLSRQYSKLTLVSPSDPDIQRLVTVPFSSRPLLAVGRYDARGQLLELTFSQDCSQPDVAIKALAQHLEEEATRPRIDACQLNPEGKLENGEKLGFELRGTAGAEVSVRLGDREPQALNEVAPGQYSGEYLVKNTDSGEFPVSFSLLNEKGQVNSTAGPVRLSGAILPEVTRVDQIDSYTWLIQGKAAPEARVRGRLQLGGYGRQEFEVQADENGQFQEEVDLGRWIPSTSGRFQLSSESPDGQVRQNQEQVLTFQSSESLRPVRVQRYDVGWGSPGWGWGFPGGWGLGSPGFGWGLGWGRGWGWGRGRRCR